MKLRIEPVQLNELSDAQKQRLRELWEPKQFDVYINDSGETFVAALFDRDWSNSGGKIIRITGGGNNKNNCLPLLSIGQLVEMIRKKRTDYIDLIESYEGWYCGTSALEVELCDALWQAVKKIL